MSVADKMDSLGASVSLALASHARTASGDNTQTKTIKAIKGQEEESNESATKPRTRSWLPSHRKRDSTSSTASSLRKSHSLRRVSSAAPAIPNRTSSRSSGDSSDNALIISPAMNRKAATTLGLLDPASQPDSFSARKLPPKRPARPRHGLFEDCVEGMQEADGVATVPSPPSPPSPPMPETGVLRQTFKFPEDSTDDHCNQHMGMLSDDFQTLMREADLAFEAVGAALKETKRATRKPRLAGTSAPPPIVPGRHNQRLRRHPSAPLAQTDSHCLVDAAPSSPNSTSQRKQRVGQSVALPSATRWHQKAQSNSVVDRGKTRHPKGLMTPARIEAIWNGKESMTRADSKSALDSPKSTGSGWSFGQSVPETHTLDPFYLESLVSAELSTAAEDVSAVPFDGPSSAPSSVPFDHAVVHRNFALQSSSSTKTQHERAFSEFSSLTATPDIPLLLVPPPKNPARFAAKSQNTTQLPTIPEVHLATQRNAQNSQLRPRPRSRSMTQGAKERNEYMCFRSTPFTLTTPAFRHGPIIFQKTGLSRQAAVAEDVDEDVDWAAFQMAILGGAGDLSDVFPPAKNEGEYDDGEIADDMTAWFDEFGFETHGELIAGSRPTTAHRSTQRDSAGSLDLAESVASSPSTVNTESDSELKTPVDSEKMAMLLQQAPQHHTLDKAAKFLRRLSSGNHSRSNSDNSNVETPWGPLVVGEAGANGIDENDADNMSMAHNLGHGLGEFLKWRSSHVYGGALY